MWAALLAFFQGWPAFMNLISEGVAELKSLNKQMENERISRAEKDMIEAKTSDEIKKAVDETADAINHLS